MRKTLSLSVSLLVVFTMSGLSIAGTVPGGGGGRSLATISGTVRDSKGNPLSGAVVSLLKEGVDQVVKQIRTATDGTFTARIAPGKYNLRAAADGFNEVVFSAVQVKSSEELVYRFNLEPVGSGKTAPERRRDRDNPRWVLGSAHSRRSIFQAGEGENETLDRVEAAAADQEQADLYADDVALSSEPTSTGNGARPQGVIETYTSFSANPLATSFSGLNFAYARPAGDNLDLVFVGQTGVGQGAPQRLEALARLRATDRHSIRVGVSGMKFRTFAPFAITVHDGSSTENSRTLSQFSLRAVDEWVVRDGIVLVVGLDYSKFVGASGDHSVTPRLGVQYDVNARTRLKAGYSSGGDELNLQNFESFEDIPVAFRQSSNTPVAIVDGRSVMERTRRLEFGMERALSEDSTVEATAFFDTTTGRGLGLFSMPASSFSGDQGASFLSIANQQGAARGLRVVYTKRFNQILSASAGYSFGRGQQLSPEGITQPADLLQGGFFQTAAMQLNASLGTGTQVRTVFRFSPNATVFAIDPFAGRLAVYDPSLSILVTQDLPTFGLPFRAEAVVDARNLLDTQASTEDGETTLSIFSTRRSVRGGIAVRF
jgi:Carboxypeptidase regulatory-like domain/TonB dependent receptor